MNHFYSFSLIFFFFSLSYFAETKQLFVLTIPKSGTHLAAKAIESLTDIPINGDVMNHEFFIEAYLLDNPNISVTGHLVSNFEPLLYNNQVKKILLIRDLRDLCISSVYWLRKNDWYSGSIDHTKFYRMNFDDQLAYMIDLHHDEFSIKAFAQRAIKWMHSPHVLTIRFEDLVGEKGGGSKEAQIDALKKIADYLEVTVSKKKLDYVVQNLWGSSKTFRKGKINNWRTQFNEKNLVLFQQILGEESKILGYSTEE